MLGRLFVGAVLVGIGVLVYQSIPDLKRYMRIRRM
ncbi:DUF6893 family small protein [Streptosporangium sandarakinum]